MRFLALLWREFRLPSASRRHCSLLLLILRRGRIVRPLAVPQHRHDVPTLAVPQQLNAVDAFGERLAALFAPRFIRAEHVGDAAKTLLLSRRLILEEAVLHPALS